MFGSTTTISFRTQDDFLSANPWWTFYMRNNLVDEVLGSHRLRQLVRDESSSLFDQRIMRSSQWAELKSALDDEATRGVSRIHAATDTRVAELLSQGGLAPIQVAVETQTRAQATRLCKEAEQRSQRKVDELDAKLSRLENKTDCAILFGGLAIVGLGLRAML